MAVDNTLCISKNLGQVIAHDLQTGEPLDWLPHEEPVYGLSVHPSQVLRHQKIAPDKLKKVEFSSWQPDTVLTACSDGRILCHDLRGGSSSESMLAGGSQFEQIHRSQQLVPCL